ncbi:MAG: hypothetical protein J7L45_01760 [Candidatus Aenigmarchaeota archaeon]|nr:hypothetical protein [Candidatus Aenigmarchaeota archaeon]
MVEFKTIESVDIKFGNNNFIEVGKMLAVTEEGENEFISLSRGFFTRDGQRRYKKSVAIPSDKEILSQIVDALKKME